MFTIGHGTRAVEELIACLDDAGVRTLVDVRRFPGSRRNPQFGQERLAASLEEAKIAYRHAEELGGRLHERRLDGAHQGAEAPALPVPGAGNIEPGEERFGCIRVGAFRSYAARMGTAEWQAALTSALAEPIPCFMCAETLWTKCHRRLIAELLQARGHHVVHLLAPGRREPHKPWDEAEYRGGKLYLCGQEVA